MIHTTSKGSASLRVDVDEQQISVTCLYGS
jgi:hypothetical protein